MKPEEHGHAYFAHDELARNLAMQLDAVERGFARVRVPATGQCRNGIGTLHGGIIMASADIAFAVACNTYPDRAAGVQMNLAFVAVPEAGDIVAEARELQRGGRVGNYEVKVLDTRARLVAHGTAIAYIRRDPATPTSRP
ncbi:PaaI family thioesterase [Myxococcus sp. K15C18031901]|uniref:PaaI family thioesterase n=1 Tax=Myxococcus dinghuensis TaxID=2906761 RepID=UPI0020A7D4B9|nr:PaaI family thioesterase [Myxococcus dinghuensis]MCP3100066.1 PaaI family thioesterase [Myxococcus dinghuensis]